MKIINFFIFKYLNLVKYYKYKFIMYILVIVCFIKFKYKEDGFKVEVKIFYSLFDFMIFFMNYFLVYFEIII